MFSFAKDERLCISAGVYLIRNGVSILYPEIKPTTFLSAVLAKYCSRYFVVCLFIFADSKMTRD